MHKDLIICTLKFFLRFNFGLNEKKKINIAIKWKKNLPHTAWVTGITLPKYFAVESIQTKRKKPEEAKAMSLAFESTITNAASEDDAVAVKGIQQRIFGGVS